MIYYIINKRIVGYEQELDNSLYDYPRLTAEQKAFYELHKCSLQEVLNLKLNEIYTPTLDELKQQKIEYFSQLAFEKRSEIVPDYKLTNAALGIYGAEENEEYYDVVNRFRNEFYRLKSLVELATTVDELNAITDNYE